MKTFKELMESEDITVELDEFDNYTAGKHKVKVKNNKNGTGEVTGSVSEVSNWLVDNGYEGLDDYDLNESDVDEGLRGKNYYYEWNLLNKTEDDAKKALKGNDFKAGGVTGYRNHKTKENADIEKTSDGWKINIYDSHGKKLA